MKKLINIIALIIFINGMLFAQNVTDAVRYSDVNFDGTARSAAMSGAFGALGGDFSVLSINPAGLGLYRSSELIFTPAINYNSVQTKYLGQSADDFRYMLSINNMGFVSCLNSRRDEGWIGVSFGLGFNRLNDFNTNQVITGYNTRSSFSDYFLDNADGILPDDLDAFWERLAFDTYIIDTVPGYVDWYETFVPLDVQQRKTIETSGRMNEWTFSLAVNYGHVLYLGATMGVQSIYYKEKTVYREYDINNVSASFDWFDFNQSLEANGTGINFKMGLIARPIDMLRIGLALHTPTFFDITEEYYNTMESNYVTGKVFPTNEYGTRLPVGENEFSLTTPLKGIGSVAVQIEKLAVIDVDFEMIDYRTMKLRNGIDGYDYYDENRVITDSLRLTGNIKLGGEVRLGHFAVRAGAAYYGNPYRSGTTNEDSYRFSVSSGFGLREKNFFFDLGGVYDLKNDNYVLYYDNISERNISRLKLMTTIGFRF